MTSERGIRGGTGGLGRVHRRGPPGYVRQYQPVIFGDAFVEYVQQEMAAASTAQLGSLGGELGAVPNLIGEALDEGSRLWPKV